jgi:hypothetical protein
MEEVLLTIERLATAADDVPSKLGDRARALARANDVLASAQALVRALHAVPDNAEHREAVGALARSIRVDALALGDAVDDVRRVQEGAAALVCRAHTLLALVDASGAAASKRSRAILGAVRSVGDAARMLQPSVAEGKPPKGKVLKVVPEVYRTLLDVVGLLCEDKLEKDAYCQMLHTAAMTAHAEAVAAAASATSEPMHRPAQGGKRKLGSKVRARAADGGAPAQPASRRRGAAAAGVAKPGPRKRGPSSSQPAREASPEMVLPRRARSCADDTPDSPPLVRERRIAENSESAEDADDDEEQEDELGDEDDDEDDGAGEQ